MTDIIFSSIVADLKAAIKHHKHPFRYVTLATADIDNFPKQRTVVLRNIDDSLNMIIYTDHRSQKITHIKNNPKSSLLFYDSKRLLQLVISTKAEIITDTQILSEIWKQMPEKNKKDYTTDRTPGKAIKNPDNVDYLENINYFTAIRLTPVTIEYLRLKRPNHIRAFFKREKSEWKGSFIVP